MSNEYKLYDEKSAYSCLVLWPVLTIVAPVDYINRLNNHLSRDKQLGNFSWDTSRSGQPNNPTHLAKAIRALDHEIIPVRAVLIHILVNGEVIGSATGNAKNVAKKYAAFHALAKLVQS